MLNICETPSSFDKRVRNIRPLLQVMDIENTDSQTIYASALALANISASICFFIPCSISVDFEYHELYIKEPELTMLIQRFKECQDAKLLKYLLIIISNLAMNPMNIAPFWHKKINEKLSDLLTIEVHP